MRASNNTVSAKRSRCEQSNTGSGARKHLGSPSGRDDGATAPRFMHPVVPSGFTEFYCFPRPLANPPGPLTPECRPDASAYVSRSITGALPVMTHALQDGLEHVPVGGTRAVCGACEGAGISFSTVFHGHSGSCHHHNCHPGLYARDPSGLHDGVAMDRQIIRSQSAAPWIPVTSTGMTPVGRRDCGNPFSHFPSWPRHATACKQNGDHPRQASTGMVLRQN